MRPNVFSRFCSNSSRFRDTKLLNEIYQREDWPWTLNSQKCPIYTKYVLPRPKCGFALLYDQPFSKYKVVENRKCTDWPQNDLKFVRSKYCIYTETLTPDAKMLVRLALRRVIFKVQGCRKLQISEMYRMTSDWPWTLTVQSTCTIYTLNCVCFALRSAVFEIRCCWKSEKMKETRWSTGRDARTQIIQ